MDQGRRRWINASWTQAVVMAVVSIVVYLTQRAHTDVFTPESMQAIAQAAIADGHLGNGVNTTLESVVARLRKAYPGRILTPAPWVLNNAGGAMGAMQVLHCSPREYVIIFGTAVGTEGHTGRFLADDYFTMLHGEQWAFAAGSVVKEVYRAGQQHWLRRGQAKQYRMPDEAWALEYARGNILSMMPFGFADSLLSTLDMVTVARTVWVSAFAMAREVLRLQR